MPGRTQTIRTQPFSPNSIAKGSRTRNATKVESVCPYCAVGCGQLVYVKDGKIIDIEGDPRSPISQGCLCPKGAATFQLVTGSHREKHVLYRRPHGTEWEQIPLEHAMNTGRRRTKKVISSAGRWPSLTWEARRSTTKRTTSSRNCSPRWVLSRSKIRPVY